MPLGPQNFYNVLDHHHESPKNWIVVNWNLGNMCNFNCSYCPDILHDGSFGWNDLETVKNFIDVVHQNYYPKKIYFDFTGGEVTLWKDLIRCIDYIKELGHEVGIISNASRTLRWWNENKDKIDHACLSFHAEYSNPDHYLNIIESIHNECRIHSNIMMHYDSDLWNICVDVAERVIQNSDISLALQPLIIDFGDTLYTYTEEQKEYIDKQWDNFGSKIKYTYDIRKKLYRGSMDMIDTVNDLKQNITVQRFVNDKTNNWKGWNCWAGLEQIVVDFDGSIYRGWCHVGGSIGNIKQPKTIAWPRKPITCDKHYCHCNFDIMCRKEMPEEMYEIIEKEDE